MTPLRVPPVGEFPQYWRYVGCDVGVPFSAVDEVARVTPRIEKSEPRDFFSGDTQAIELGLKFIAIASSQAPFRECLLGFLTAQRRGNAIAGFAVRHHEPQHECLTGCRRQRALIDQL